MKKIKFVLCVCLLCFSCTIYAQTTTIWLVRHAEKQATDTSAVMMAANDPDLSVDGKLRAEALAAELKGQKIGVVFSTSYKRTLQTGEPTLKHFKLTKAETYNPANLPAFVRHVLTYYAGSNVLVVGHSNTVIPTLQAFGGLKPFDALTDDDYDFLFKITISPNGITNVAVKHYGVKHHTTEIPK